MSNNQNLFSQSYNEIVKNVIGGETQHFQMLDNPQSFSWPVAPAGQLSPQAYQLMSAAPKYSAVGGFGGVGTSTLFSNYKMVFSHIGFGNSPEYMQQRNKLSDEATIAENNITKAYGDANTAYNTAKQIGGAFFETQYPSIADWMKSGTGKFYQTKIDTEAKTAENIYEQIQALDSANQPSALRDTLDLTKYPTGSPSGGNAPRGWTIVPDGAGILRWQPAFTIGKTGQEWRAQLTNGSIGKKSIKLSASKSDTSINQSWAGGSASYSTPFWGVYGSGGWSETNFSKSDSSVEVIIELESATTVRITPGDWYDGGFLKQLATAGREGTGYKILQPYTATEGAHPLFGKNGLCSTMVTGLVVAYKPSFRITMQSSTYKEFDQKISASAGLRIGPFSFGGDGGHYEKKVNTTGNKTTFEGGSTSDDPVIIGLTVGFPGVDKP